ncbi:hypothetical protein PTTG_08541 [Puccinia triticina 1-1 BBBD Race 1]|uniref:Amino acid permease/ SLC12A domain-containing protein n=1 Tax=Puccinia triticina (isolate 1-1 / race 1 (BBBD)) TaxID=630390 RepID=A0A180GL34_PUCT1|nr:hypothetical protein PTTG_08541 [Puccinia triticina 1-1 BBBD Race 1]
MYSTCEPISMYSCARVLADCGFEELGRLAATKFYSGGKKSYILLSKDTLGAQLPSRSLTQTAILTIKTMESHLDQQGNDCAVSGTSANSGLSSPTAREGRNNSTMTSSSQDTKEPKHEQSPEYTNSRPNFGTTQVSSISVPSSKWRAPWAGYVGRSKISVKTKRNQSQVPIDPSTQTRLEFLGYRQELHRSWDFWSLFSFSYCNASVLQGAIGAVAASYSLSGPILITVGMLICVMLLACLNMALGEMSSAFPVAGAMFSWTFKLARANPHLRDWARIMSWVVGFLLFMSHLIMQLQTGLQFTSMFITVITGSGVDWKFTSAQTALVALGFIATTGLASCTTLSRSPLFWKIVGLMTVLLHISACIALVTTSKHQRSFTSLFTTTGSKYKSKSKGWNLLYGWSGVTLVTGSESIPHLTEETHKAAKTTPRAMFLSTVFIGFMQVLFCICIGMALTPIAHKVTGLAFIDFLFAHCPKPVALFIGITLVWTSFLGNVSQFFSASRFFWALARDKALPMSKTWRKVTSDRRPIRATLLMIGLSLLLGLFSFERTGYAVRIFGPTCVLLIMFCYLTPLMLYAFSEKDVYNRDGSNVWTLGRLSKPMTWISIAFALLHIAIHSGPIGWPVTRATFPYAPFVLITTVAISICFWFLYGRSHYAGPIKSLTTWTVGYEVEIPRKLPDAFARPEKTVNFDLPSTREPTTNARSLANMTTHQNTELEIPQAYCTYDSSGSLWSATESQVPNHSFFHE